MRIILNLIVATIVLIGGHLFCKDRNKILSRTCKWTTCIFKKTQIIVSELFKGCLHGDRMCWFIFISLLLGWALPMIAIVSVWALCSNGFVAVGYTAAIIIFEYIFSKISQFYAKRHLGIIY